MITDWRFLHPWFLALLPLPLLWLLWQWRRGGRSVPAFIFSDTALLAGLPATLRQRALRLLPTIRTGALCLGILALARPQYGTVQRHVNSLGVDISLVIDVSGSMQADDFRPNRLEAAKTVVSEFIKRRPNDRISVVVFGETAAVLSPPTFDGEAARVFVDSIYDGIIPNDKTAIGMGLALGVAKLKDSAAKSRVAVLLTDGESNAGAIQPLQAAEAAKALKVRVYTIGIGTDGVVRMPVKTPSGQVFYQPMQTSIDEETLTKIAETTGGKYYRAKDEKALGKIYEEIDHLEKTELEVSSFSNYDERFVLLWGPGLVLVLIEWVLRALWLVRIP